MTLVHALLAASSFAAPDQPAPINITVGGVAKICRTGTIVCPARSPICDDTSVATMRMGDEGLEIVGVKPGRTLCSAASAGGVRQVYAVAVR